jgi:secondary thiamine-phosphate synthase enzyme
MPGAYSDAADIWSIVRHVVITIHTCKAVEFVDVTDRLAEVVADSGLIEGALIVQSRHTTAGLMINENEALLLADLETMFERVAPGDAGYAHDDFSRRGHSLGPRERVNGHAHCRAALLRTSEYVGISAGTLNLGRWQRVFFVDFDGGQPRQLGLTLLGQGTHPLRRLV